MRTFGRVCLYYACICGGIWAGLWLSAELFSKPEVDRLRALEPDAFICGNMFLPNMFLGAGIGAITGWVLARRIANRWLPLA